MSDNVLSKEDVKSLLREKTPSAEDVERLKLLLQARFETERDRTGLNQIDFADAVDLPKKFPGRIERGEITAPTLWYLCIASQVFGCTLDFLVGLSNERNVNDGGPVDDELLMLRYYRNQNEAWRQAFIEFLNDVRNIEEIEAAPIADESMLIRWYQQCDDLGKDRMLSFAKEMARLNSSQKRYIEAQERLAAMKDEMNDHTYASVVSMIEDVFDVSVDDADK